MIDPITEQILMEAKAVDSLKKILPQIKAVLLKKDFKGMMRLSKQLPQKRNFKQIKSEAMRLPNFRQKYNEAKRAIKNSKVLDGSLEEPASLGVALVALNTGMKVSDIIKAGDKGVLQSSMILSLIPGGAFVGPIVTLVYFLIIISGLLIIGHGVIVPAAAILAKGIGYILSVIGNGFKGIWTVVSSHTEVGVTKTDVVNTLLGTKIQPDTFESIGKAMETKAPAGSTASMFFKRKR